MHTFFLTVPSESKLLEAIDKLAVAQTTHLNSGSLDLRFVDLL